MDAKRGYVPEDDRNFSPEAIQKMKTASRHISYLINEGYDLRVQTVWIDGFNEIITLEVLFSHSILFRCMDGTIRDLVALREQPDLIILQPRSPSCGVKQRYDGTFTGTLINGSGVLPRRD